MKGKQLGTAIKEAINAHGKYVVQKVWSTDVVEHGFSGSKDIFITVTVRDRKRKKQ